MTSRDSQSAAAVFMMRPARFGFNAETAASNAFQHASAESPQTAALAEFDAVACALRAAGVEVIVAEDSPQPHKPDAIFPNNWVSFHRDGTVVLYPMCAPNRRAERREEVVEAVVRRGGFRVSRTVDLSHREAQGQYLEGTGSLVLDRVSRVAYACLSPRTDLDALGEFAQRLDYDLVAFDASDEAGRPVYHTNVLMAIGASFAVVCSEAIDDPKRRAQVLAGLAATGHEVVEITRGQMHAFAGNCLELSTPRGPAVAISATAWDALGGAQRRALERHAMPLRVAVPTVERVGGGGVRCMLAEIHLPRRAA